MKRQELIEMSQKERDRLQVLKQARSRQITQGQAAAQMEVSERWVRKLLRRMKKEGDRVVVHGLRGRPGNRQIAEPVRARAVGLVKREYRDFGPTLASEYLAERHGIEASRETVRGWMLAAGLWRKRRCVWQPHLAHFGSLIWPTLRVDGLGFRGFGPDPIYRNNHQSCGNVGIPRGLRDFQGRWEGWKTRVCFSMLSTDRHFHSLVFVGRFCSFLPLVDGSAEAVGLGAGLQNVRSIGDSIQ